MNSRTGGTPAPVAQDRLAHLYFTVVRVAYPRVERAAHGDELVGDAVALARPGQRWPSPTVALDLLRHGFAARLRPANVTSQLNDVARLVGFAGHAGRTWGRANLSLFAVFGVAVILGGYAVVQGIEAVSSPAAALAGLALFATAVLVAVWMATRSWTVADAHGARQVAAYGLVWTCALVPGTVSTSLVAVALWPVGSVVVFLAVVCIGAAHAARRGLESPPPVDRA